MNSGLTSRLTLRTSSRFGIALVLAVALIVACGDGGDSAQLRIPEQGQQGPGTAVPDSEEGSSTPAAPAPVAGGSNGESAPGEEQTQQPDGTPAAAAPATKKVLDVKWFGQETYYWCGPGSTRMALGTRLADPPSQTTLANFMGTTTNGTDHIGLVANALNKYFPGAGYKSRTITEPPTKAQRDLSKTDLVARIDNGFPIVANVISGWRPPGCPAGTIYHYVAVVGYDDSGAKVLIADPAADGKGGGASWNNSSLAIDQGAKAQLYAESGVPEYWVVNVRDAIVEVHTEIVRGAYTHVTPYRAGERVALTKFPDVELVIADVL